MDKMLLLDPKRRISAKEAINHFWIKNFDYTTVPPLKLPQHQDCHELWSKKQRKERRSINPRGNSQPFEGQESETAYPPAATGAILQYDRRRSSPANGYVPSTAVNPTKLEAIDQAVSAAVHLSDTNLLVRLLQYTTEAEDTAIFSKLSQSGQFDMQSGDQRPMKERLLDALSRRAYHGGSTASGNFAAAHPGSAVQPVPTAVNPVDSSGAYRGVGHHLQPPPPPHYR